MPPVLPGLLSAKGLECISIIASFAGRATRLMGIASPDFCPRCQLDAVAISGPVTPATQSPKHDGLLELQIQREILLAGASSARNLRQNKRASLAEAYLREVTNHIFYLGQSK